MDFLLNVNMTPSLMPLLTTDGHNCRHVVSIGKGAASDHEIVDIANLNHEVIITHDLDYGTILAFSGQNKPSVIIFRIHNVGPLIFYNLIRNNWDKIENPLTEGAIVIFEPATVWVHRLPIKK